MWFLARFPPLHFFCSQHHVSRLSLHCDFGQILSGSSSKPCSPPSWLKYVSAAQACYPSTQEHQSPGAQTHTLQKVNGQGRQKVYSWTSRVSEQLSLLSPGPQHKKGKEGRKEGSAAGCSSHWGSSALPLPIYSKLNILCEWVRGSSLQASGQQVGVMRKGVNNFK